MFFLLWHFAIHHCFQMNMYNKKLYTVECGQENIKITTMSDYFMFKGMIENGFVYK